MGEVRKISLEELQEKENYNIEELNDLYHTIVDGIKIHNYYKDRELLIKAKELFYKSKMMFEVAVMTKEIGLSFYSEGNIAKSIRFFEEAVDILQYHVHDRDIHETLVSYMTSIGVGYYQLVSYDASLNAYEKCKPWINDGLPNDVLHRYYYEYSLTCIATKHFDKAIKLLTRALSYTDNNVKIGYIYNNIGRCYWKMKIYKDSIYHYVKAIDLFKAEGNNTGLGMIYNNLSMLYYSIKDIDKATEYIEKCFEVFDKSNVQKCIIYYDTYIRVILRKNAFGDAVDKLLEFIELSDKYFFSRRYTLDAIELVVDRLSKSRNYEYGIKLKKVIIGLLNENEVKDVKNSNYEERLYGFLGMLKYLLKTNIY